MIVTCFSPLVIRHKSGYGYSDLDMKYFLSKATTMTTVKVTCYISVHLKSEQTTFLLIGTSVVVISSL